MKHLVFIISLILFINLNVYPQNNSINFTDENGKNRFLIEDNECAYYVDDVLHGLSISYFKKIITYFVLENLKTVNMPELGCFLMKSWIS